MIIKVRGIKSHSGVANLVAYAATDKGRIADYRQQGIFHNLSHTDLRSIILQLQTNYDDYARKRSDGNKARHVILSVNPLDRDKVTIEIMDDLASTYIQRAFPNAIVFGTHHCSENHWHSHLIVSANELFSNKATRHSKEELRSIHLDMLRYMREHHPALTIGINERAWGNREFSEGAYYKAKRNPELKLTREELSERIQGIFRLSENSKQFYEKLRKEGFTTYNHKENVKGVLWDDEGKKMRFSRLGVPFESITKLDEQYNRLAELDDIRENTRTLSNDREDDDISHE